MAMINEEVLLPASSDANLLTKMQARATILFYSILDDTVRSGLVRCGQTDLTNPDLTLYQSDLTL